MSTSKSTYAHREGLILNAVVAAGISGWGEAAPLPGFSVESTSRVETELKAALKRLPGVEIDTDREPRDVMADMMGSIALQCPSSKFGLETLIADLYSKARGLTLREAWFQSPHCSNAVEINYLLTNNRERIRDQIEKLLEDGVSTFKLKVGRDPAAEIALLRGIRKQLGEQTNIRLDANCAFELEQAIDFLQAISELNIEYVEEPLMNPSPESLKALAGSSTAPIALDETIAKWCGNESGGFTAFAESAWVESKVFKFAILKPAILGGLLDCFDFIGCLGSKGITSVITSSLDCDVGVTAAAQLAGACGSKLPACGLATSTRLESSLGNARLRIVDGSLKLPDSSGLGMEVDLAASGKYLEEVAL